MRTFIEHITRKAGNTALKYFKKSGLKFSHKKNVADVVTEADHASNKVLLDAIKKRFPTHGIISEETGEENIDAEYVWIIDPLDGTRNFLTHTPLWGVMVGFAHRKQMIAAAIYDPNHNEFVYAERGKGAYLNGKRIRCSNTRTLPFSYGTTSAVLRKDKMQFFVTMIKTLRGNDIWMNNLGSIAMNAIAVASGRRDWLVTSGGKLWDYTIPTLLFKESGCKVTDFRGGAWQWTSHGMVVSNPALHKKLLKMVR